MFVIRMLDGEEIHGSEGDQLVINPDTAVVTVHRAERFGEVMTHYSPAAWRSVTQRVKSTGVRSSVPSGAGAVSVNGAPARQGV